VALAIAAARRKSQVVGTDVSTPALALATRNAARLGIGNVAFVESDWFDALPHECFDLIAGNPPYVAAGDPHLTEGDLRHEPQQALTSGGDGLRAIRAIVASAPAHLTPGGWLQLEHGHDQTGPSAHCSATPVSPKSARRAISPACCVSVSVN
jgi:release factor glutamine methyltransferase